jgi:hypothetical protein
MSQTKNSLEMWRTHFHKKNEAETTEDGKHPHRLGSTGFAMQSKAIDEIIDLAQKQVELNSKSGKLSKKLAIQYLRDLVDELESEME